MGIVVDSSLNNSEKVNDKQPDEPVRFLFITRSLNYGGSERQLVALAKGLQSREKSVAVATFYDGGDLRKEMDESGVQVFSLRKRGRWDILGFLARLVCLLKAKRPLLLHGYLGSANILAVLVRPFFPRMCVVWGVRASNMELERYGWLDRVLYRIEGVLSRCADAIITNSEAGLNYASTHGFSSNRMLAIPNGIDIERFAPDRDLHSHVRRIWGVGENEELIGLVGRLDPMKGHHTFLEAVALLLNDRPTVRFVCVGDGPETYRKSLMHAAEQLGVRKHVMWVRSSAQVETFYRALDVLTSCSLYGEGFSNVIGEAMACGTPCVVTDVGDARQIIGDTGSVVPPRNPEALAKAWRETLEMGVAERTRQGQRARERIIQHFSLERLIQETALVLEATIEAREQGTR